MTASTMYYSIAVPHPDIPGAFWSKYNIVGAAPQWVLDPTSGTRKVFASQELAELAGYRTMVMRMNRIGDVKQVAVTRTNRAPVAEARKRVVSQTQSEVARIFARFGKPGIEGE